MHVKKVELTNFKRFTKTTIDNLPADARLVVLTGPNGTGKSSIFESFNFWLRQQSPWSASMESNYFLKKSAEESPGSSGPTIEFHEPLPEDTSSRRRVFYIRSAYRHEPDFTSDGVRPQQPFERTPGPETLNMPEQRVKGNYEHLTSLSIRELFRAENDDVTAKELRERFIGKIRTAMLDVFDDLVLDSPGNPIEDGTFFFTKGSSSGFPYKNLSGGEKAAFDLLLDFVVSMETYTSSVFCIDEPELHLGSRVQAKLLNALLELLPVGCQLWLATHSTGMMREALRQYELTPAEVLFLDTYGLDFDVEQRLEPRTPDREFWRHTLEVALGDMAELVSPETVFLCESEIDFDADVYRTIFRASKPGCDFISIANSDQVIKGRGIAGAIEIMSPGTKIIKIIDRDDLSDEEVETLQSKGVRVLKRRNLESFLLSDEILAALCDQAGKPDKASEIIKCRDEAIASALAAGIAYRPILEVARNFGSLRAEHDHASRRGESEWPQMRFKFREPDDPKGHKFMFQITEEWVQGRTSELLPPATDSFIASANDLMVWARRLFDLHLRWSRLPECRISIRVIMYLEGQHPAQRWHTDPSVATIIWVPPHDDRLMAERPNDGSVRVLVNPSDRAAAWMIGGDHVGLCARDAAPTWHAVRPLEALVGEARVVATAFLWPPAGTSGLETPDPELRTTCLPDLTRFGVSAA